WRLGFPVQSRWTWTWCAPFAMPVTETVTDPMPKAREIVGAGGAGAGVGGAGVATWAWVGAGVGTAAAGAAGGPGLSGALLATPGSPHPDTPRRTAPAHTRRSLRMFSSEDTTATGYSSAAEGDQQEVARERRRKPP